MLSMQERNRRENPIREGVKVADVKTIKDVKMTGKQYLEYRRYEDARRDKNRIRTSEHFKKHGLMYVFGGAIIALVAVFNGYIDAMTPYVPVEYEMIDIFGIPVAVVVINVLLLAVAGAWLIHGVGFVIIKR